jgi:dTDP-4-dehydrorhamnose reductase
VTNAGGVSWCFLARVVAELLGVEAHIAAVTTAEWGAAAPRPAQSVLSNAKYLEAGLPPLRSEREAVAAYLASRMDTAALDAADRVMGGGR